MLAAISDDIQNIQLSGTIHRFLSRPYLVELKGQNLTRLQSKIDKVEVSAPNQTGRLLKIVAGVTFTALMLFSNTQCSQALANNSFETFTPNLEQAHSLITNTMMILLGVAFISVIGYFVISLPKATKNDELTWKETNKLNQHLDKYYNQLRYCKNCHVVYDKQGYYSFVKDGVIEKLLKNSGVFSFRAIETKRTLNQEL